MMAPGSSAYVAPNSTASVPPKLWPTTIGRARCRPRINREMSAAARGIKLGHAVSPAAANGRPSNPGRVSAYTSYRLASESISRFHCHDPQNSAGMKMTACRPRVPKRSTCIMPTSKDSATGVVRPGTDARAASGAATGAAPERTNAANMAQGRIACRATHAITVGRYGIGCSACGEGQRQRGGRSDIAGQPYHVRALSLSHNRRGHAVKQRAVAGGSINCFLFAQPGPSSAASTETFLVKMSIAPGLVRRMRRHSGRRWAATRDTANDGAYRAGGRWHAAGDPPHRHDARRIQRRGLDAARHAGGRPNRDVRRSMASPGERRHVSDGSCDLRAVAAALAIVRHSAIELGVREQVLGLHRWHPEGRVLAHARFRLLAQLELLDVKTFRSGGTCLHPSAR